MSTVYIVPSSSEARFSHRVSILVSGYIRIFAAKFPGPEFFLFGGVVAHYAMTLCDRSSHLL
ncbi:hypothetical protein [Thalassoporum mexicanum]|uniref:hypothetical protein n=1 Tax=Thalassoporum mexicanum TaxID=3457544 RepID=UPI0002EA6221|nr:hypothetical protein [Pseudanabaena sp. PCC 7367]